MNDDLIKVVRGGVEIILPRTTYEKIYADRSYLTVNRVKRSYGEYTCAMVCKKEKGKLVVRIPLHRLIMGSPAFKHVDHIDRNPLNNDPTNLRLATVSQNGANRKKAKGTKHEHKGVSNKKKWFYASIKKDGIMYRASRFEAAEEAAKVYDKLAKFLYGEYAGLNFNGESGWKRD